MTPIKDGDRVELGGYIGTVQPDAVADYVAPLTGLRWVKWDSGGSSWAPDDCLWKIEQ